jgi:phage gp16-like protein
MARSEDNDLSDKCMAILRDVYARSMARNSRITHPAWLAAGAYNKMDPSKRSPLLVKYAARLALRKMAASLCREEHEAREEASEGMQGQLFELLQKQYPAKRGPEIIYVAREDLTLAERQWNIDRLRKESAAKAKHADALQAETDALVARGYFEQVAA